MRFNGNRRHVTVWRTKFRDLPSGGRRILKAAYKSGGFNKGYLHVKRIQRER